mgnify:CR=1 FL=1
MAQVQQLDDRTLLDFFTRLREKRAKLKTEFTAADAADRQKQEGIEVEVLRRLDERGIDNISARDVGTAYRSTRTSATAADKDTFTDYIKEHNAWELADIRVSKVGVQQFREEHDDLPPGVNFTQTTVVNFRRT